jgi:hypothetical protein
MLLSLLWFSEPKGVVSTGTVAPVQLVREFSCRMDDADDVPDIECAEAFDAFFSRFSGSPQVDQLQTATRLANAHRSRQSAYDLMKSLVNALQHCGFSLWQFRSCSFIIIHINSQMVCSCVTWFTPYMCIASSSYI